MANPTHTSISIFSPRNTAPNRIANGGISKVTNNKLADPALARMAKYKKYASAVDKIAMPIRAPHTSDESEKLGGPSNMNTIGAIKIVLPINIPSAFIRGA
jgi:hypothetical protein